MNASEFIDEVKKSSFCPNDFDHKYYLFQNYQKLATDTLNEFHRVCTKNNIFYTLAFGSLLGAIRDNGQIPWDYDVDVFALYEQKNLLIESLQSDLSDRYYFYCPEIDPKCRHMIMRIAPKGYHSEVLHVDVFFLIGTPELENDRLNFRNRISQIANTRYYKLVRPFEEADTYKRAIKLILNKCLLFKHNVYNDFIMFNKMCLSYPLHKSTYFTTADTYSNSEEYKTSDIMERTLIRIDTGDFFIPSGFEDLLKKEYGDYMKIPDLHARIYEFIKHLNRLERFSKIC